MGIFRRLFGGDDDKDDRTGTSGTAQPTAAAEAGAAEGASAPGGGTATGFSGKRLKGGGRVGPGAVILAGDLGQASIGRRALGGQ